MNVYIPVLLFASLKSETLCFSILYVILRHRLFYGLIIPLCVLYYLVTITGALYSNPTKYLEFSFIMQFYVTSLYLQTCNHDVRRMGKR